MKLNYSAILSAPILVTKETTGLPSGFKIRFFHYIGLLRILVVIPFFN